MQRQKLRVVLLASLAVALIAPASRAGSIFDFDDKNPPPPAKPATPQKAEPPHVEPITSKPEPEPARPQPNEAPTAPAPSLKPVPTTAELQRVGKLFKEVYAADLADRSPAARRTLAMRLLDEAAKAESTPTDQFVMLSGARQAAQEAADLPLCEQAVDAMAAAFDVNAFTLKLDSAFKMTLKSDSAANTGGNVRTALALLDQLVAAEDFSDASRLSTLMTRAAADDPMYSLIAEHRARDLDAIRVAYDRISKDVAKLRTSPDDPAASFAVGRWLAFYVGDWPRALPLLAKGSDANLKTLAAAEVGKSTDVDGILSAAEGWWKLAEAQPELSKRQIRGHAAELYQANYADLIGLRKDLADGRISEGFYSPGARAIDLLALADTKRDSAEGKWTKTPDGLAAGNADSRLELPYHPPGEYIFRVEFICRGGNHTVYQGLSAGGAACCWTVGWERWTGFEDINRLGIEKNPAHLRLTDPIQDNRLYVSTVEVRGGELRGYLDNRLLVDWKAGYRSMKIPDMRYPRDPLRLAVGTAVSGASFIRIEVLELAEGGKIVK